MTSPATSRCIAAMLLVLTGGVSRAAETSTPANTPFPGVAAFVWIEGQAIGAPFEVSTDGASVFINDVRLTGVSSASFEKKIRAFEEDNAPSEPRRRGKMRSDETYLSPEVLGSVNAADSDLFSPVESDTQRHADRLVSFLKDALAQDVILISKTGEPFLLVDRSGCYFELLMLAIQSTETQQYLDAALNALPKEANVQVWRKHLSSLNLSGRLRDLAVATTGRMLQVEREANNTYAAKIRLGRLAYPMTVFGMFLAVVSLGHLLMCLPRPYDDVAPVVTKGSVKATTNSLLLVSALSTMDLIWTLMAHQAGEMKELNPLASELIHDPLLLLVFKGIATSVGCGLLYSLRHNYRAQFATWWLCLVCTVLTFRWLTFNSMFVS